MCRRITCPTCGKPTFAGCGRHVESVLGDVPPPERCRCPAAGTGDAVRRAGAAGAGEARGRVLGALRSVLRRGRR
jgi:hypothetical protein